MSNIISLNNNDINDMGWNILKDFFNWTLFFRSFRFTKSGEDITENSHILPTQFSPLVTSYISIFIIIYYNYLLIG